MERQKKEGSSDMSNLPRCQKPYAWVKSRLLDRAQRFSSDEGDADRAEFMSGVEWVLDYLDENRFLGVLAEIEEDRVLEL